MLRNKVQKRLRIKHNYKYKADSCYNCVHFKGEKGLDDNYTNTCHLDANYDNPHQEVYLLPITYGICDGHQRGG